jgi:hypothetical protein
MTRSIINDYTFDQVDDLPNLTYEFKRQAKGTFRCEMKCYYMDEIILFHATAYANNGKQLDKLIRKFTEQVLDATDGQILISTLKLRLPIIKWEVSKTNVRWKLNEMREYFIESVLAYENSGGRIFAETLGIGLSDPFREAIKYYNEHGFTALPFNYEKIFNVKFKNGPKQAQRIERRIKAIIKPVIKKKPTKAIRVRQPQKTSKIKAFEPRKARTEVGRRIARSRRIEGKNVKELK